MAKKHAAQQQVTKMAAKTIAAVAKPMTIWKSMYNRKVAFSADSIVRNLAHAWRHERLWRYIIGTTKSVVNLAVRANAIMVTVMIRAQRIAVGITARGPKGAIEEVMRKPTPQSSIMQIIHVRLKSTLNTNRLFA